jgi:glycogen synthase
MLASRFEGLPLVALEAMAMRRPVIGTRVCGIDEAVIDGQTGWLVAADDPAALADSIVGLLNDPESAERFGLAGRRRYEAAFTASRMIDGTRAAYADFFQRSNEASMNRPMTDATRSGLQPGWAARFPAAPMPAPRPVRAATVGSAPAATLSSERSRLA